MTKHVNRQESLRQSAAAEAAPWCSVRGAARTGALLVAFAAAGYAGGGALEFTAFPRATLCLSCVLFASWMMGTFSGDPLPVVGVPLVGAALTAIFAAMLFFSFVPTPTGGPTVSPPPWEAPVQFPRFISMIVTALPALPYSVSSIAGALWRR